MVKGVLYTTAGSRRSVIALDGKTGDLIWSHSVREGSRAAIAPRQLSGRGVSYWTDGKGDERVTVPRRIPFMRRPRTVRVDRDRLSPRRRDSRIFDMSQGSLDGHLRKSWDRVIAAQPIRQGRSLKRRRKRPSAAARTRANTSPLVCRKLSVFTTDYAFGTSWPCQPARPLHSTSARLIDVVSQVNSIASPRSANLTVARRRGGGAPPVIKGGTS